MILWTVKDIDAMVTQYLQSSKALDHSISSTTHSVSLIILIDDLIVCATVRFHIFRYPIQSSYLQAIVISQREVC